jgi:hypothetical protein
MYSLGTVRTEELKNGKWLAYFEGWVETPLTKGDTEADAHQKLITYATNKREQSKDAR